MPRLTLPSEDCVFRLDSEYGFNQAFPMTFNDVGLSDDGFNIIEGVSSNVVWKEVNYYEWSECTLEVIFAPDRTYENEENDWYDIFGSVDTYNTIAYNGYSDKLAYKLINNDSTQIIQECDLPLEKDVYIHIIATFNSNTFEQKLYCNGELKSNGTANTRIKNINRGQIVGRHVGGTYKRASIYNRALTAQEVTDRYNEVTFNVQ
jgi:hypothetical protein